MGLKLTTTASMLGLLLCGLSLFLVAPKAHALSQTECKPFNSMYDLCTVYKYNFEYGVWVKVETYLKLTKEAIVHQ